MITCKLIISASDYDLLSVKQIYSEARKNYDGTDKVECFYRFVYQNNRTIQFDDILYLFDKCLWLSIKKWAKKQNQTSKQLHKEFVNYVWISVSNMYLDEFFYVIFGNRKKETDERIAFKRAMYYATPLKDNDEFIESEILGDRTYFIDLYFEHIERLTKVIQSLPPEKHRWKYVAGMVLQGYRIRHIAEALETSVVTIRSDIKKLTWLFDNLNYLGNR